MLDNVGCRLSKQDVASNEMADEDKWVSRTFWAKTYDWIMLHNKKINTVLACIATMPYAIAVSESSWLIIDILRNIPAKASVYQIISSKFML